ncbi:MAG: hypothetical protein Q4C14_08205 [Bacillota bacterium]|nr:hypothetical protein [Bacillota bacterium]
MYSEISENIISVKKNYFTELKNFLESENSSVLTEKQHCIMYLRASGCSMDEISKRLDISKTAVFKSIKLSEKKINKILNESGLTNSDDFSMYGGDYEKEI